MSVKDFQEYEKKRMENNAWDVLKVKVKERIHDASVLKKNTSLHI